MGEFLCCMTFDMFALVVEVDGMTCFCRASTNAVACCSSSRSDRSGLLVELLALWVLELQWQALVVEVDFGEGASVQWHFR